jgi:hypothetical protein
MIGYDNLEINCYLSNGFIGGAFPLQIDSMMVHATLCELLKDNGNEDILDNSIDISSDNFRNEVPLEQFKDMYKTSGSYIINPTQDTTFISKRFRQNMLEYLDEGNKKKVNLGSGIYKEYHLPFSKIVTKQIKFYVLGNKEQIEYLLNEHIKYIGKKSSYGYGEVLEWDIQLIEKEQWFYNKVFPFEIEEYKEYLLKRIYMAYKPLYRDAENFAECYLTRMECE